MAERAELLAAEDALDGTRRWAADLLGPVLRWVVADRPVSIWMLLCAGVLPVLLTAGWLLGDAVQSASYSPVRQTVSVLAGHAAHDRWIVTSALYLIGVGYLALAAGLAALGRPARVGLVVAGLAGIGIAVCPEPVHGSTPQHLAFTTLGALTITIWPVLVRPRGTGSRLLGKRVTVIVTAVFVGLLLWTFAETRNGPLLGLAERTSSTLDICWPFLVALAVSRAHRRAEPEVSLHASPGMRCGTSI